MFFFKSREDFAGHCGEEGEPEHVLTDGSIEVEEEEECVDDFLGPEGVKDLCEKGIHNRWAKTVCIKESEIKFDSRADVADGCWWPRFFRVTILQKI